MNTALLHQSQAVHSHSAWAYDALYKHTHTYCLCNSGASSVQHTLHCSQRVLQRCALAQAQLHCGNLG